MLRTIQEEAGFGDTILVGGFEGLGSHFPRSLQLAQFCLLENLWQVESNQGLQV
jgi:hypothetical protein